MNCKNIYSSKVKKRNKRAKNRSETTAEKNKKNQVRNLLDSSQNRAGTFQKIHNTGCSNTQMGRPIL